MRTVDVDQIYYFWAYVFQLKKSSHFCKFFNFINRFFESL